MSVNINTFTFQFWDGPLPQIPQRKNIVTHRPGVNGVAHQMLGSWGDTFSVVLTSHHASFADAADFYKTICTDLVGNGPHNLTFEGLNWSGDFGVVYNVESIELLNMQKATLLMHEPFYTYSNGALLVVRMTLTPQAT